MKRQTQLGHDRRPGQASTARVWWSACLLPALLAAALLAPGTDSRGASSIRPASVAERERPGGWDPWFPDRGTEPGSAAIKAGKNAGRAEDLRGVRSRLARRAAPLLRDGSRGQQLQRLAGTTAPPVLNAVVLMCDFSDSLLYGRWGQVPGDFPPPRQSEFYYGAHDSLYFHHLLSDVRDYFDQVSDGRFTLEFEVVAEVANLAAPMGFYGDHPEEGEQPFLLALDTITTLDPVVDFSRFDTVILIHAGAGEETDILDDSPEQIFSTYLSPEDFVQAQAETLLATPYIPSQDFPEGEGIDQVLILPETEYQDPVGGFGGYFGSLGVYCFEVGLRLGMLSLSDFTPAGRPDSQGIGEFGLMGFGLFVGAGFIPDHPCGFNKLLMGWLDPYPVIPGAEQTYRLTPAEAPGEPLAAARVEISGQEYWLLEYRLQDPDGNRVFSWADDKNGDGVPNFTASDDPTFVPVPFQDFFDPTLHVRETLAAAEFDFFMSENSARPEGVKGAGSGIYVWHVDEGVVHGAFGAESNLFNADPARKSVDLEEADGIQDLDTRVGSPYILGSDDDSYRGEDNATFGPTTVPDSRSAGGAWTGVLIDLISPVVADSTGGGSGFITYVDTMTFRCQRLPAPATHPVASATRRLPGVNLLGSHLLAVDLDVPADGVFEIVVGGSSGQVFAFEPDLSEHPVPDGDSDLAVPLAVGTDASGEPVAWNGPAAAGDIDGDGWPEVVLTTRTGLYAFNGEDGSEVGGDGDALERGLLVALEHCRLPPVLLPMTGDQPYDPSTTVVVCVVDSTASGISLRFVDARAGVEVLDLMLGAVTVPSVPLLLAQTLHVPLRDQVDDTAALLAISWNPAVADPEIEAAIELNVIPGPAALAGGLVPSSGAQDPGHRFLIVTGADGQVELIRLDENGDVEQSVWPATVTVHGSPAPAIFPDLAGALAKGEPARPTQTSGVALTAENRFALASPAGIYLQGWPREPRPPVWGSAPEQAPSPLRTENDVLYQSRDGRAYLYDATGNLAPGWPLAGPGAVAGTGLFIDLDADGSREFVACGTAQRIQGVDTEAAELVTEPLAGLTVWSPVGTADQTPADRLSGWTMWRGTPWRVPGRAPTGLVMAGGGFLVEGSHICYPNPLTTDNLRIRAESRQPGEARVVILNLEGEEIMTAGPTRVPGGEPFEFEMPFTGLASGVYLCRLVFNCECGGTETSLVTFAAAR